MMIFHDIQDVEEWLEPHDYISFWEAVEPYNLTLQDRDHCDEMIASGKVDQSLVLRVLKSMAENALALKFHLKDRVHHPKRYRMQ